jgi:hypothetical protein
MNITKPTPLEIQRLRGCRWRLWRFSASHDHLAAEIHEYDTTPIYISFLLCERIAVPTWAKLGTPELLHVKDQQLHFRDVESDILVVCQQVVLHSEVPEHWQALQT